MGVERFQFESIAGIDDGRIREAWEQAAKRARDDCSDRPGLEKAREVHLITYFEPVPDTDTVNVYFKIKDTLPPRQSAAYNMRAGKGGLLFNEVSREDVRQRSFDDVGGPRQAVGGEE